MTLTYVFKYVFHKLGQFVSSRQLHWLFVLLIGSQYINFHVLSIIQSSSIGSPDLPIAHINKRLICDGRKKRIGNSYKPNSPIFTYLFGIHCISMVDLSLFNGCPISKHDLDIAHLHWNLFPLLNRRYQNR